MGFLGEGGCLPTPWPGCFLCSGEWHFKTPCDANDRVSCPLLSSLSPADNEGPHTVFHPLWNERNVNPGRGTHLKAQWSPPTAPTQIFLKPAGATSTSWQQREKHSQRGTSPTQVSEVITNKIVKFSSTLFIIYFSGRCFSLWMKLIMYSHMGDRLIR